MKKVAADELKSRAAGEKDVEKEHDTPKEESKKSEAKAEAKPEKKAESDSAESKGLPTEESVEDSKVLSEKDGAAKMSMKDEGFALEEPKVLTAAAKKDDTKKPEEDDINHKFEAFGRFAAGVINGRMKSLVAYGSGGVGKTYTVTTELQKANKKIFNPELHDPGDTSYDYVKMTGKMTAPAVYQAMYEHNGKTLLFDDCDSVLQDDNAINLFKGALDTSGDGMIDWGSAKKLKDSTGAAIPGKFAFSGRAIFISNLDVGRDKNGKQLNAQLQPIISRGYGINLSMDAAKTMDRIQHIATSKDGQMTNLKFPGTPDYTHDDMSAVLKYMDKHREAAADLNVRTVGTLLAIKLDAEKAGVRWEDDAKYVYLRKSEDNDIYNGSLFNTQNRSIQKALGIDVRSVEDKKIEWCDMKKSALKNVVTSEEYIGQ
jgi:Cdc6-like AAA superfamily ATPase